MKSYDYKPFNWRENWWWLPAAAVVALVLKAFL